MAAPAAQASFWVVLGSYQDASNAQVASQQAGMSVSEPLQVVDFDTSAGRWHRLLLGPFEVRSQAAEVLAEVRSNGHGDAWLLVGDQGDQGDHGDQDEAWPSVVTLESDDDLEPLVRGGSDELDELDDLVEFNPYGDLRDFEELPPMPEANVHLLSEQHKRPVSEPPPGYQLHKLRRGGS